MESQKVIKWTGKDVVANVFVCLINALLLCGIVAMFVYLNGISDESFRTVFNAPGAIIRYCFLIVLIITVMWLFFFLEDREFLRNASNLEMIFLILEISIVICYFTGMHLNLYLRTLCLAPLLVLFLKNKRSSIITGFIFSALMLLVDTLPNTKTYIPSYWVFIISVSTCVIGVALMSSLYSRLKMLLMSFVLSVPAIAFVLLELIEGLPNEFVQRLVCATLSGPASVAVFIILLSLLESMFKKTTCFKLAELTDHKASLIKRMIREAPGTFNHAIVVSNIAEACATAIGEDALFARTCAYYHDIGKLRRPELFAENQPDGINPHDDLTPELSTNIIKAHTQDGYQLLLKHRLPKEIATVCLEHHGTVPIFFFYAKAKKFTDGDVDIDPYCYQGPKPQSKISAIIMIADGCEAATRTLKDRSR